MRALIHHIRRMPRWLEFAIVISGAFGWFILSSFASIGAEPVAQSLSDGTLYSLVFFELGILAALGGFLALRGWTLPDLTIAPRWRAVLIGLGLAVAAYVLVFIARLIFFSLFPDMSAIAQGHTIEAAALGAGAILAICAVNSIYEEIFVTAYAMTVTQATRGLWFAFNVSVILRLSYHLYQGPISIPDILPIGVLFAYYYARTRDVWPLIVAHGTINFVSLTMLAAQS